MPVVIIDIPSGLKSSAKAQLHKEAAESMHHAYQIPDNRVFLREWAAEHTSFDGVIGAAFRPICHYIVPPILTVESRQTLVSSVSSAVARACNLRTEVVKLPSGEEVSTQWVLSFFFEVPLEQAALDDLMAFENPMVPKAKH
jgi:phenylpyruvate tautomerase PptA (4-oxalocrotonate tautomerase family)